MIRCVLRGAVAQLGERKAGSLEVRGSIPLSSTKSALFYLRGLNGGDWDCALVPRFFNGDGSGLFYFYEIKRKWQTSSLSELSGEMRVRERLWISSRRLQI